MADDAALLRQLQLAHEAGDDEGAIAIAKQMAAQPISPVVDKPAPVKRGPPAPGLDPSEGGGTLSFGPWDTGIKTSQGVDRFLSGAGQSIADTGRGINQLFGGQTQKDTDEQRRLDAPLDRTGMGMLGNVAGGIAQFALPGMGAEAAGAKIASRMATNPGALQAAQAIYRIASPAATGAGFGAAAPVGTDETRLGNTGRGAIAGEAGGVLGGGVGSILRTGEDALSKGARLGADIARKYSIPLSMPEIMKGAVGHIADTLDKLPFSGADTRRDAQRGAFNDALGRTAGIPDAEGAINHDMTDAAHDAVGAAIGNMAKGHTALVTPADIAKAQAVVDATHPLTGTASADNSRIIQNWANKLFGPRSRMQQVANPLPGGPVGNIAGDTWRENHTALGRQIRSTQDGDLKYHLGKLNEAHLDAMEHGMPPADFDEFQNLRGQYRNIKTIEPLAEKAGLDGINPTLLQNRAIASKNNRGDVGELGDFAKSYLSKRYPDSGTAQRAAIYTGLTGLAGAGANEMFGGKEGENQHSASEAMLIPALGIGMGALGSRAMASRLMARYHTARLPESIAHGVSGTTNTFPAAAAMVANDLHPGSDSTDAPGADEQPMADGGQPVMKKSSFWDLVKQAYHEATGPSEPTPPPANDGTTASGTKGADFDRYVNGNVDRMSQ